MKPFSSAVRYRLLLIAAHDDEVRDSDAHSPLYRTVDVNGLAVRMKWCTTCQFYRPPRCSHCSVCNTCVEVWFCRYLDKRTSNSLIQAILSLFHSVLWHSWLGDRKGIWPACEEIGVGLLVVTFWLEIRTSYSSSCPFFLAPIKSRMETYWYRPIQVHLEKWPLKWREGERECPFKIAMTWRLVSSSHNWMRLVGRDFSTQLRTSSPFSLYRPIMEQATSWDGQRSNTSNLI